MPKNATSVKTIESLKKRFLGDFEKTFLNRIELAKYKVGTKSNLLAIAYRNRISKEYDLCSEILEDAINKPQNILKGYELEVRQILAALTRKIDTFLLRLEEFSQIEARLVKSKKLLVELEPDFIPYLTYNLKHKESHFVSCPISGLVAYKIFQGFSSEALDAYILLSTEFDPDELDSPLDVCQGLKKKFQKHVTNYKITGKKVTLWDHSILIVVQDQNNRIVSVADGTLIVHKNNSVFYAAHIVVDNSLRSQGIGVWMNDILIQAAENSLIDGIQDGLFELSSLSKSKYHLMGEISEIEFPDRVFYNKNSFRRLPFHGRMGRKTLWPLLYAQPDTNYLLSSFELDKWFSLPMFLCFRAFNTLELTKKLAFTFTTMLFDYFSLFYKEGSEWDRRFLEEGIKKHPDVQFVSFPKKTDEIEGFITRTGLASEILLKYYPNHNYTSERKEIIFLLANNDI